MVHMKSIIADLMLHVNESRIDSLRIELVIQSDPSFYSEEVVSPNQREVVKRVEISCGRVPENMVSIKHHSLIRPHEGIIVIMTHTTLSHKDDV
jgi:hypothetical protein